MQQTPFTPLGQTTPAFPGTYPRALLKFPSLCTCRDALFVFLSLFPSRSMSSIMTCPWWLLFTLSNFTLDCLFKNVCYCFYFVLVSLFLSFLLSCFVFFCLVFFLFPFVSFSVLFSFPFVWFGLVSVLFYLVSFEEKSLVINFRKWHLTVILTYLLFFLFVFLGWLFLKHLILFC